MPQLSSSVPAVDVFIIVLYVGGPRRQKKRRLSHLHQTVAGTESELGKDLVAVGRRKAYLRLKNQKPYPP